MKSIILRQDEISRVLSGAQTQFARPVKEVIGYPGIFTGDCELFGSCGYKGIAKSDYWIKNKRDFAKNPDLYHIILGKQECNENGCFEINPIPIRCPFGAPGDRLWVREKFSYHVRITDPDYLPPDYPEQAMGVWYWADGNPDWGDWKRPSSSSQMPRWASRLTLEVLNVRVVRVQDITNDEVFAEGITPFEGVHSHQSAEAWDPIYYYRDLWDSIYAKKGLGWDVNPWIWLCDFKVV